MGGSILVVGASIVYTLKATYCSFLRVLYSPLNNESIGPWWMKYEKDQKQKGKEGKKGE